MKNKKQDPKLVSKEEYEIDFIAKKFKVRRSVVRAIVKRAGISRRKVYAGLRLAGYQAYKK
jgi:hypothetical protein